MSDFILDASILVQYVVTDIHTAHVDVLFESVGTTITAYVPEFCLLECTNVLWKQVRFNNVPPATADGHAKDLQALDLVIVPVTCSLRLGLYCAG
jgi:predicted nucleic acid-binding protein